MKKILRKIRNICISIGAFLFSGINKVFASSIIEDVLQQGEPFINTLYGPPNLIEEIKLEKIEFIWGIFKHLIIPIVLIIGIIVYLKKSKSSFMKKVIVTFICVLIVVLLCIGINYFITNYIQNYLY